MGLPADSSKAFEAALALAAGKKDEERVFGVTLILRKPELLSSDSEARARLLKALGSHDSAAHFLQRLFRSDPPLQRLALALLVALCLDSSAVAELLIPCLEGLVAAALEATNRGDEVEADGDQEGSASSSPSVVWGRVEVRQVLQLLRQGRHHAPSPEAVSDISQAVCWLLAETAPGKRWEATILTNPDLAEACLLLVQEVTAADAPSSSPAPGSTDGAAYQTFVLSSCLRPELRGTPARALALGLLAEQLQQSVKPSDLVLEKLDEVLGEALLGGEGTRLAALHLARATVSRLGLSFGLASKKPLLQRLKPLLSLMAGELRLGLEGHATSDTVCAACAALEATIVAFGQESGALEASGNLEDVSDCLRQLHRAVHDVHNWCSDLVQEGVPHVDCSPGAVPKELPMLARVAAAWQLEDPRQFATEFTRSLAVFERLPVGEFAVLLPCVHDLHDWHLTPALGQVLKMALHGLEPEAGVEDAVAAWRQAVLMLTEVALDAAAYLPDADIPEAPAKGGKAPGNSSPFRPSRRCPPIPEGLASTGLPLPQATLNQIQKPVPAGDPTHAGVRKLCSWSKALWENVAPMASSDEQLGELAVLCAALLVSVPPAAAASMNLRDVWANVAAVLFAGKSADGATWRLALRLAGSIMDRHRGFPLAFAGLAASSSSSSKAPALEPPPGGLPGEGPSRKDGDDEDEWAEGDLAAFRALQEFLRGLQKGGVLDTFRAAAKEAGPSIAATDNTPTTTPKETSAPGKTSPPTTRTPSTTTSKPTAATAPSPVNVAAAADSLCLDEMD